MKNHRFGEQYPSPLSIIWCDWIPGMPLVSTCLALLLMAEQSQALAVWSCFPIGVPLDCLSILITGWLLVEPPSLCKLLGYSWIYIALSRCSPSIQIRCWYTDDVKINSVTGFDAVILHSRLLCVAKICTCKIHFSVIHSYTPRYCKQFLPVGFTDQNFVRIWCYIPQFRLHWFDHSITIWWSTKVMKFPSTTQFLNHFYTVKLH
jgi:hypothetical protein